MTPIANTNPQGGIIRRTLIWLGWHELGMLLSLIALGAGIWLFVEIADKVFSGGTTNIDRKILLAFRTPGHLDDPIGSPMVEEAARDLTALGGTTVLALLTAIITGYLILDGKQRMALFVIASVGTGALASSLLKELFHRPRPELVPHLMQAFTTSFPSGHSMMSAMVYLTLGALLARSEERRRVKTYLLLVATLLTLTVGVTRVYLGVHWPTDVLAGWTAGAIWALLCWILARTLQQRHQIEAEQEHSLPEED